MAVNVEGVDYTHITSTSRMQTVPTGAEVCGSERL